MKDNNGCADNLIGLGPFRDPDRCSNSFRNEIENLNHDPNAVASNDQHRIFRPLKGCEEKEKSAMQVT